MTAPIMLRAEQVSVSRGKTEVLHAIDLDLNAGEVLAVLGPNGAGKSTLLETFGGVLAPAHGRLECNGRVATVLQSPDLARRSVQANVELGLAWWGVARTERRARAVEALAAIKADHLARRRAVQLSGGERRRVHLARAVATRPDILLLDEPFAGLDPASRAGLLDDAGAAFRSSAGSVVLVVHDRGEAWALADRIVVLIDGRIAAEGNPREVLDHPPTPAVARFLGFSGETRDGGGMLLTRPAHVVVDPDGDITATIDRLTPLEDGARAELATSTGRLSVTVPYPGPHVGDVMRVRIIGGVRFEREGPLR